FNLISIALDRLRDKTVERVLSFGAKPGQEVRGEVLVHERPVESATQIRGDHGFVDRRRELLEDGDVVTNETEERRAPRRDGDGIEQRDRAEVAALEQVRAERDRPAEVVSRDRGPLELPVVEQLREQPRLGAERDVAPGPR